VNNMALNIPGGEFLTGSLDVISQSLTIPVLIILLVIVIISIITLGGAIAEYTSRRKVPVGTIRDLIYEINRAESVDALKNVISNAKIPKAQKRALDEIASSSELGEASREALARKLFEFEEEKTMNSLQKTDIITRIGPTLGLMGTLIPMGPGLAALGAGDINTLASSLTVAFNTTIVGIGSGALCYFIGKVRSGWYDRYLSDLDALIDAVLDRMKN
jgi:biopolymer transport protein ExbB/TolQ